MGYDYALVHLFYTIPPAVLLTICFYPLCSGIHVYKVLFLISIAVVSTTPWDSYLIHNRIWTYPEDVIVGPTLFKIPAEEIFFFIIQTYNTSLFYLILSKPTFHPVYLRGQQLLNNGRRLRLWRWLGTVVIVIAVGVGAGLVQKHAEGLYMGLILVWAGPFVLLLWSLAHQFILELPLSNTLIPIALPTLYLWIVDTLALRRGTWVIEAGTKVGIHLWEGLELEEAVFFLATNVLIVFGLIAFDNALAVLETFPALFPSIPRLPSPRLLVEALLVPVQAYDDGRIEGLQQALTRLRAKSRSFYLASGVFEGRLRIDLVLLYSFCRVADDLVDEASSVEEAKRWIIKLVHYLDIAYSEKAPTVTGYIKQTFPSFAQPALLLLPFHYLTSKPLYDMLKGFETDLNFTSSSEPFPIHDEATLETYGSRVAGTVAELCIQLVYYHTTSDAPGEQVERTVSAGGRMGIALQYVNIARDISVDAANARVYIPTTWLKAHASGPEHVLNDSSGLVVETLRQHLLDVAMHIYDESKGAIDQLPQEARGPMRVAVESYIEIGRVLRRPGYKVKAGRATVPKLRRLRVAWKALNA